ncbi:MAG: helix-turn-helix transcriptional regulator [Anaerolineae bacterium]|jgi:DNA-binding HxlR family transcriptional regulator|nr:helix-turn-helix transcriptional regulator [Anaerolineae bacterium]
MALEQHDPERCPVKATMEVIGGKWKPLIVYYLMGGTKRFGQLQRLLPDVTQRMLTKHLRELESDGVIHREVYREVPPRVEYSLTELGKSLAPILELMLKWGEKYVESQPLRATEQLEGDLASE